MQCQQSAENITKLLLMVFKMNYSLPLYGLTQVISKPTILPTSFSCTDLIFTNQTNLVIESDVHASLYPNCHYQTFFTKLNLKIENCLI